jgi:hypothetical protein
MADCPSASQISLYVEEKLPAEEAGNIWEHILHCPTCREVYATLLEIRTLEKNGYLPNVSYAEWTAAQKRIAQSAASPKENLSNATDDSRQRDSFIDTFLSGTVFAASAHLFHGVFPSFHSAPSLGHGEGAAAEGAPAEGAPAEGGHDHNLIHDEPVRNDPLAPSMSGEPQPNSLHHQEVHGMEHFTENAPKEIGLSPVAGQSDLIKQGYDNTCAIRCQELILRDFGIPASEESLRQQAMDHGWYDPHGGTSEENVGNLLQMYGLDVHRYDDANIFNLTSELAQGHKVIVGVDSDELWHHSILTGFEDKVGIDGTDHALIVSGIDTSDPNHLKVVLTDPGTGDIAKAYPVEQFVDAWKDSHCFMVATNDAIPSFNHEMANFDYQTGHLNQIGGVDWHDLDQAAHMFHDGPVDAHLTGEFARSIHDSSDGGSFASTLTEIGHDPFAHSSVHTTEPGVHAHATHPTDWAETHSADHSHGSEDHRHDPFDAHHGLDHDMEHHNSLDHFDYDDHHEDYRDDHRDDHHDDSHFLYNDDQDWGHGSTHDDPFSDDHHHLL